MKHHLNTLFVTTEEAYLAKEGEAVLVRIEKRTKLRVPIHNPGGIVCFGRIGVSPSLMGLCGERGVAITLLSASGQFRAGSTGSRRGTCCCGRSSTAGPTRLVAPFAGAWIETMSASVSTDSTRVAPFAGRGLKPDPGESRSSGLQSRPLRGGVD